MARVVDGTDRRRVRGVEFDQLESGSKRSRLKHRGRLSIGKGKDPSEPERNPPS